MYCIHCGEFEDDGSEVGAVFIHNYCAETPEGMSSLVTALESFGFKAPLSIKARLFVHKIKNALVGT